MDSSLSHALGGKGGGERARGDVMGYGIGPSDDAFWRNERSSLSFPVAHNHGLAAWICNQRRGRRLGGELGGWAYMDRNSSENTRTRGGVVVYKRE